MITAWLLSLLPLLAVQQPDDPPERSSTGEEFVIDQANYSYPPSLTRLVMITWDPEILPLSPDSLMSLLSVDKAVSDLRLRLDQLEGIEKARAYLSFRAIETAPDRGIAMGHLGVISQSLKATADAVLQSKVLVSELQRRLQQLLLGAHTRALDQHRENLSGLRAGVEQATMRLREIQTLETKLIQQAGGRNLNRQAIFNAVQNLKDRKSTLALQQAGVAARQAALAKRIAAIAEEIKQKQAEDPIARELEKIVALHESAFEYQQKLVESQVASQLETAEIEKELALAKVQLLQHQQDAAQRAGADRLAALNDELAGTSMEVVEIEAQLQIIDRELAEMNPERLLALADQYEREVTMQLPLAQKMLEQAQQRLFEAELRLQSVAEPRVIDLVPGESEEGQADPAEPRPLKATE